jgi:streptogramin lyase
MAHVAPGTDFAGFRIESVVGRGGMGVVFRARQPELDRVVALKVIAPERIEDDGAVERFLREARAAAAVEHPNVVPIHAAGVHDEMAYLSMRFIDGQDVRTRVRLGGPLDPERAAAIVAQIAAALDVIHRAGYIHRDVKPANVLLDREGDAYLTDFGLAKALGAGGPTRSGEWVGTLDYVAPEQIRGGRIDARADVYALGGVLHYMLTAHVPFERDTDEAKLWALLSAPPPRPSTLRPELSDELDAVVERALAKHPADRYLSAGDLARATLAAAHGEPADTVTERMVARGAAAPGGAPREPGIVEDAPTLTRVGRASAPRRRRRVALAAAAVAAVGLAAAVVALLSAGGPSRPTSAAHGASGGNALSPRRAPHVGAVVRDVGSRPSGIAEAAGSIWVTSFNLRRITLIDVRTSRERRFHPLVGRHSMAILAARGAVWVALGRERAVLRLDPRSGRITGRITTALVPVALASGRGGLWILTGAQGHPAEVLRYDAAGKRLLASVYLPNGAVSIAVGGGSVWAGEAPLPYLLRLDPSTGTFTRVDRLIGVAKTLAYGGGFLWAALQEKNAIARIDPRHPGDSVTTAVGNRPHGLAIAGGRLYVACGIDHTVVTVDARSALRVPPALRVALNPYTMAADRRHVWVTGRSADAVTRIDYR